METRFHLYSHYLIVTLCPNCVSLSSGIEFLTTVTIQRRYLLSITWADGAPPPCVGSQLHVSEVLGCSCSSESIKRLAEQMSAGTPLFSLDTDSQARGLFALVTKELRNGLPSWLDYIFHSTLLNVSASVALLPGAETCQIWEHYDFIGC